MTSSRLTPIKLKDSPVQQADKPAKLHLLGWRFGFLKVQNIKFPVKSKAETLTYNVVQPIGAGQTYLSEFYRAISGLNKLMADCLPKSKIFNVWKDFWNELGSGNL